MPQLDEFLADVGKSGLVSPGDLDRARKGLPDAAASDGEAAEVLARRLVEGGQLTPYQARKLLSGVTRGFFLGAYRILRRLGQGGMGKVYLARNEENGREFAVKVLPPRKATEEENALERFRRETDLSRRVRHPNLARTFEVGEADGVHYMVMEHVPGDSLYNVVRSRAGGPLRVPDAARLFLQVLDGLEAAHQAGLVHRDIKPSNLMITPQGDAKILDLGLARSTAEESPLTHPNAVIGTLDYASPEQLTDAARADLRSDLYSLGCTLYFALAGRPPFEGGDVINKIFKQRMEDPPRLERVAKGVPPAFAAIVRKLMAKDPADRYQTVRDVQRDLTRWTDPAVVAALLGADAESAKAFRPPAPVLEDEDLRFLEDNRPGAGKSPRALRTFGEAEPKPAPRQKPPPPPRPAVVLTDEDEPLETDLSGKPVLPRLAPPPDDRWMIRLIAIVCAAIALLLLFIALWR